MISNNEYDKFQWERLLLNGQPEDIELVLEALLSNLCEEFPFKSFQFIGVLRAGGLLAHCLNVMANRENFWKYPVVLFSSFPYISFLPRDINTFTFKEIVELPLIIVDESVKSTFTYYILKSYLKRNFQKYNIQEILEVFYVLLI